MSITAECSINCYRHFKDHDCEGKLNKIQSDCQQLGGTSGATEQRKHAPEACLAQDVQLVPNSVKLFAKHLEIFILPAERGVCIRVIFF